MKEYLRKCMQIQRNFSKISPKSFQTQTKRSTSASQVQSKCMSITCQNAERAERSEASDAWLCYERCSQGVPIVCPCLLLPAYACSSLPPSAHACQCLSMLEHACPFLLVIAHALPLSAHACQCLLMLEHAIQLIILNALPVHMLRQVPKNRAFA